MKNPIWYAFLIICSLAVTFSTVSCTSADEEGDIFSESEDLGDEIGDEVNDELGDEFDDIGDAGEDDLDDDEDVDDLMTITRIKISTGTVP